MNIDQVVVLMSTYNGKKYLDKQIDSILNQKKVQVHIVIRDDGSQDNTRQILEKYEKNDKIDVVYGENIGYTQSFLKLLSIVSQNVAKYYAFADQDDVWSSSKLEVAVKKLKMRRGSLYYSDLQFTDEELNITGRKNYKAYKKSFESAMCLSSVAGCTMVFNRELLQETLKINVAHIPNLVGHDGLIYRVALLLGKNVIYDENSYILFRRTDSNTSNASANIFSKLKTAIEIFTKFTGYQSEVAKVMLEAYGTQISDRFTKELIVMTNYRHSFKNKMYLLFGCHVTTGILYVDLVVKASILFNKY